jgi:hypothetical protein
MVALIPLGLKFFSSSYLPIFLLLGPPAKAFDYFMVFGTFLKKIRLVPCTIVIDGEMGNW